MYVWASQRRPSDCKTLTSATLPLLPLHCNADLPHTMHATAQPCRRSAPRTHCHTSTLLLFATCIQLHCTAARPHSLQHKAFNPRWGSQMYLVRGTYPVSNPPVAHFFHADAHRRSPRGPAAHGSTRIHVHGSLQSLPPHLSALLCCLQPSSCTTSWQPNTAPFLLPRILTI